MSTLFCCVPSLSSLLWSHHDHAARQSTLWVTSVPVCSWPRLPARRVASPLALGHHLQPLPQMLNLLQILHKWRVMQELQLLQQGWGLVGSPLPTRLERLWVVWGKPCKLVWCTLCLQWFTLMFWGCLSCVSGLIGWICCSFVTRCMKLFQSHMKLRERICHEHMVTSFNVGHPVVHWQ